MNTANIQHLKRQILEEDYLQSCNAEFPKQYEDRLTHKFILEMGDLDLWTDDWTLGSTYQCCKTDAEIVIDYPPRFPEERFFESNKL